MYVKKIRKFRDTIKLLPHVGTLQVHALLITVNIVITTAAQTSFALISSHLGYSNIQGILYYVIFTKSSPKRKKS